MLSVFVFLPELSTVARAVLHTVESPQAQHPNHPAPRRIQRAAS